MTNTPEIDVEKLTRESFVAYNLICETIKANGNSSSAAFSGALSYIFECLFKMKVPEEKVHKIGDSIAMAAVESGAQYLAKYETKA